MWSVSATITIFLFIHLCGHTRGHTHTHTFAKHCVILSNVKWGVGIGYLIVLVLFYVMYANMPGRATKTKWIGSIWLMSRSITTAIGLSAKTCIFCLYRSGKICCSGHAVSYPCGRHFVFSQLNRRIYEWYGWPDDEKILYIIFWSFCV